MWFDICLMFKLGDVFEIWKFMDVIILINVLIFLYYWDVNWLFESGC